MSQLIIEYVVHCQDYLSEQRNTSLEQLDAATRRVQTVEKDLEKSQSEIEALKKENKSLKKTMYAYQMVSKIPGALGNNGANIASYFVSFILFDPQNRPSLIKKLNVFIEMQLLHKSIQHRLLPILTFGPPSLGPTELHRSLKTTTLLHRQTRRIHGKIQRKNDEHGKDLARRIRT